MYIRIYVYGRNGRYIYVISKETFPIKCIDDSN